MTTKLPALSTTVLHNKLVISGATVALTAIVGTAGIASAHSLTNNSYGPSNINQCQKDYKSYKFKDSSDCYNWYNQQHGSWGYGGQPPHHQPPQKHHYHIHFGFVSHFFQHNQHQHSKHSKH